MLMKKIKFLFKMKRLIKFNNKFYKIKLMSLKMLLFKKLIHKIN